MNLPESNALPDSSITLLEEHVVYATCGHVGVIAILKFEPLDRSRSRLVPVLSFKINSPDEPGEADRRIADALKREIVDWIDGNLLLRVRWGPGADLAIVTDMTPDHKKKAALEDRSRRQLMLLPDFRAIQNRESSL